VGLKALGFGTLRGIGGGARGFSKLVSWFDGKRGLAGGLAIVERGALGLGAELEGMRRLSPEADGSSALALSNLCQTSSSAWPP